MLGNWKKWEKAHHFRGKYTVKSIEFDAQTDFKITLAMPSHKLVLSLLYKPTLQIIHSKALNRIKKELSDYYGLHFATRESFFKIDESPYLQWLSRESGALSYEFQHYCILASNMLIDIASDNEPALSTDMDQII